MAYAEEVLADTPEGYWKLNETSGTNIVDSSGNGHDGTFNGTITSAPGIAEGTSIDFNGSSHYITVPDHANLRFTGDFALEAWARMEGAAATQDMITKSVFGASGTGYALAFTINIVPFAAIYRAASGQSNVTGAANNKTNVGHVVAVYDSAAQTLTLYLNGVQVGQTTSVTAAASNTQDLGIGAWLNAGVTEYFDGRLDSVAVYGHTLTAARIQAHFNARELPPQPNMFVTSTTPATTSTGTSAGSPLLVPYPGSLVAGDAIALYVGLKPDTATITTPTGFTAVPNAAASGGSGTTGADTGPVKAAWFWRVADGSESGNISITLGSTPNCAIGQSFTIKPIPRGSNWSVEGGNGVDTATGTPFAATMGQNPGLEINDVAMVFGCIPTDVSTPSQFSSETLTATGLTANLVTEAEPETTSGNDLGGVFCFFRVEAGPATAAPAFSATAGGTTTNVAGPIVLARFRLNPPTYAASTQTPMPQVAAVGRAASI